MSADFKTMTTSAFTCWGLVTSLIRSNWNIGVLLENVSGFNSLCFEVYNFSLFTARLFLFLWNLKNRLHKALRKGSHRRAERDKRRRARTWETSGNSGVGWELCCIWYVNSRHESLTWRVNSEEGRGSAAPTDRQINEIRDSTWRGRCLFDNRM